MQTIRFMLAALTMLAWVVSSNSCLLATVAAPEVDACCEHESGESPAPEIPGPCGINDCGKCVTLESGVNLSVFAPLVAPAAVWMEDVLLSERLRAVVQRSLLEVPELPEDSPPGPVLSWCEVVQKVLPVRGPSIEV
jgi:hypothetical protein